MVEKNYGRLWSESEDPDDIYGEEEYKLKNPLGWAEVRKYVDEKEKLQSRLSCVDGLFEALQNHKIQNQRKVTQKDIDVACSQYCFTRKDIYTHLKENLSLTKLYKEKKNNKIIFCFRKK